jgi:hypothetical protein
MEPTFDLPPAPSRKVMYGIGIGAVLALITATYLFQRSQRAKDQPAPNMGVDPILQTDDWKQSVKHLAQAFEFRLRNDEERLDDMAAQLVRLSAQFMNGQQATFADAPAQPAAVSMPAPDNMVVGQEPMNDIQSNPEVGAIAGAPPVGAAVSL